MKIILAAASILSSTMAATLAIKGPLTEKSSYHLHEAFVQNSGAKVNGTPYQGYEVALGYISNVAPQDIDYMTKFINGWLQQQAQKTRLVKFSIDRAEANARQVVITGDYMTNDFYQLRYKLQDALKSATPPSGRRYTLDLNNNGVAVPSIYVGEISGFTPNQVKRRINRRIEQSHIIHNDPYFEVEMNNLQVHQTK
ncbi:hypothetical protein [Candidatus Odyssella thessalonicensis]|uniref:hypothetical protein n=1 Tax=Candidatus Odyssella thessalonicensis TaxID=84647 RepID=UPI000225B4C2|nr:hypothetical protein [Candidatus Odyssella thessalonicensis]